MIGNFIHDVGMIGSGVTITSGLMAWLGNNATAIGALVSIISLVITSIFLVLNYLLNLKAYKLRQRETDK